MDASASASVPAAAAPAAAACVPVVPEVPDGAVVEVEEEAVVPAQHMQTQTLSPNGPPGRRRSINAVASLLAGVGL